MCAIDVAVSAVLASMSLCIARQMAVEKSDFARIRVIFRSMKNFQSQIPQPIVRATGHPHAFKRTTARGMQRTKPLERIRTRSRRPDLEGRNARSQT